MTSNDLKLSKIGHFILNKLGNTSIKIKNKIDLIYSSDIDYNSFQKFQLEMEAFQRFNLKTEVMKEDEIRQALSNFASELEETLDGFIEKINDNKKIKESVDARVKFFELLSLMVEHKQMQNGNADVDSLTKSLIKLNSLIDYTLNINKKMPSLTESEIATLKESKESVKELMNELITIEANNNIESDKNDDDETNKNRRQQ